MPLKKARGVLCVQSMHIGDVIATLPSLSLIKQAFPHVRLGLVCNAQVKDLVEDRPWIDELFLYAGGLNYRKSWELAREVRRKGYDATLAFDGRKWGGLIGFLAGHKARLTTDAAGPALPWPKSLLYTHCLKDDRRPGLSRADRLHIYAARAFGLRNAPPLRDPAAPPPDETVLAAEAFLRENRESGPTVVFAVTGRTVEKNWPAHEFASLARALYAERKARLFIVGLEREKELAGEILYRAGVPGANLCGRTSLGELAALLRRADLLVAVDSGTAHLGALAGLRQITIFLASSPAEWAPRNPRGEVLMRRSVLERFGPPAQIPWRAATEVEASLVAERALALLGPQNPESQDPSTALAASSLHL